MARAWWCRYEVISKPHATARLRPYALGTPFGALDPAQQGRRHGLAAAVDEPVRDSDASSAW
jgi:hypothetical protein